MFRHSTIVLPIAVMAFAVVSFLLLIDFSIAPPAHAPTNQPASNTNNDNTNASSKADCRPTGCSGQVCSDEDVVTDCVFQAGYACYQNSVCERQANGQCGWTETAELRACIEAASTGTLEPSGQVQGAEDTQLTLPIVLDVSLGN